MPDTNRISVVIPTYNRASLIGRAITCVLQQTCAPSEVIVVDDGSSDDTPAVVAAFGSRVRFLTQSHGGPSRARNYGVAEAASRWIAFLDSDDLWVPTHLERMSRALAATEGRAALYFTNAEWATPSGMKLYWDLVKFKPRSDIDFIEDASDLVFRQVQPMLLPFSMFRKDFYLASGGLWDALWTAEDTHLFIRLGVTYPVCAINGIGGRVTSDDADNANRLTVAYNTDTRNRWRGMVLVYNDLLKRFPSLRPESIRKLKDRLAHSHWRLGRLAWMEGDTSAALHDLWMALITHPGTLVQIVTSAITKRFSPSVEDPFRS